MVVPEQSGLADTINGLSGLGVEERVVKLLEGGLELEQDLLLSAPKAQDDGHHPFRFGHGRLQVCAFDVVGLGVVRRVELVAGGEDGEGHEERGHADTRRRDGRVLDLVSVNHVSHLESRFGLLGRWLVLAESVDVFLLSSRELGVVPRLEAAVVEQLL